MTRAARNPRGPVTRPRLLVLDSSYTIEKTQDLGLDQSVLCRDLDGFFEHVWSVHPFGELSSLTHASSTGAPEIQELNERHSFVQAHPGRYRALARLFPLNFALAQISLVRRLLRLVRNERIGLVRAGDPLYIGLLGWIVARLSGVPLVIRINGNNEKVRATTGAPIYPRLLRSMAVERKIERFLLPRTDLIVAPNQDNVDFALANGARPDRVEIFRLGNLLSPAHLLAPGERVADEALFEKLGISPGRYLLCVSRLQSLKFPDDAVRALASVRSTHGDVRLVLAGEGPLRPELERLAGELGVSSAVVFTGNLGQDALAQLYPHAGAVISPLTGRALSEAALGAAPIVAYDLDWQGDLIETEVTGELVPFRDVDALARSTAKMLDNRDYARRMGEAVRQRALDMLDPEKLNAHERETYAKLLKLPAT